MSRRALVNLALGALVLLLAALAYFRPGVTPPPDHPPLTTLDPAALSHIRITRGNGREMLLERTREGWLMRKPYRHPADSARVRQLITIVRAPSYRQLDPEASRLQAYGLAAPVARLEADGLALEIGGTEPIGGLRYVRCEGQVHLIDNVYTYLVLAQPEAFLDRQILGPSPSPIAAVELPTFRVFRDPSGRWSIDPPAPPVDQARLGAWLAAWQSARAMAVMPAPADGGKPVILSFAGGATARVLELLRGEQPLLIDRGAKLAYRLPRGSPLLARPGTETPP